MGRGFTFGELKAANVAPAFARTIGIAVDHRRNNKSDAIKTENVQRLKEYLSRLVVFPRGKKAKAEKKNKDEAIVQNMDVVLGKKPGLLDDHTHEAARGLTDEEKKRKVYQYLRKCLRKQKLVGIIEQRRVRKEKKKADKKD